MTDRTLRISARMAEEIQQWASDELSQWPRDTAYAADLENLLSQLTAAAPAPDPEARLAEAITPAPQPEGQIDGWKQLKLAAETFCTSVEAGEIRSKRSYNAFKDALTSIGSATPTAQEAVPVDLSHGWLIHKAGRGWYRPNAKGYTGCLAEAGRYSRADALLYSHPNGLDGPRDNITIKHESEATTTRYDLCASGQVRVVAQAALASRAAHPPQLSEMIAAVERAFDEIRELNMSGRDENGHRWANSDLIDQTVTEGLVALRALKGSDNG